MSARASLIAAAAMSVLLDGSVPALQAGDTAPGFSRPAFGGKQLQLADYRGKLVVLNFWASWCGPCLKEMPTFVTWQRDYGPRGLQVIGISMDDDIASAERLLARRPVSYPVVWGDAALGNKFGGVLGLPLTYLIDEKGKILGRYQGGTLTELEARIKARLPAAPR